MEVLKKYQVHLKGISPLIMHCDRLCNPLDPLTKKKKELTSIKKKQDEHHIAIANLEWTSSIYYDEEIGIHIPSKMIIGCFKSAARKFRLGRDTKAITLDCAMGTPLIGYENITPSELWDKKDDKGNQIHVYFTTVVIKMSRLVRYFPIFRNWETKFNLYLNLEILSEDDLKNIISVSGFEYGFGEFRPEKASGTCGKFIIEDFKEIKK